MKSLLAWAIGRGWRRGLVGGERIWLVVGAAALLLDVYKRQGWVETSPGQGVGNPQLSSPVVFATVLNDLAATLPKPAESPADLTSRLALDIAGYPKVPPLARFGP